VIASDDRGDPAAGAPSSPGGRQSPRPAGRGGFFGRRSGKTLRDGQADDMETVLSALRIDLTVPPPPLLAALFATPVDDVTLEIGFGGGEHLLSAVRADPSTGRIGAEPFINGMAKFCRALAALPAGNVRLHAEDALPLLDWLPPGSLAGIDLFYPDPWPKRRHWKRRFINPRNLDRFARVLRPGGAFRFASDIDHYVNWTLAALDAHTAFEWRVAGPDGWRKPHPGWVRTRYEAKALREGRTPCYLAFERL
jgi:tRNA (guanine-N7-)-methyltransferase